MAYSFDEDLEFLGKLDSEELNDLVNIITANNKGKETNWFRKQIAKLSIKIGNLLLKSAKYKQHYPNHKNYWQLIAAEIQLFGANTLVSKLLRDSKGIKYKEILRNVCKKTNKMKNIKNIKKTKIDYNKKLTTMEIEKNLLMALLENCVENMKPEDLEKVVVELGLKINGSIKTASVIATCQSLFKAGGFESYKLLVIIANADIFKILLGHGLSFVANASLTRTAAILVGSVGWGINGICTLTRIMGPAYRIAIPAVITIAILRKQYYEKYKFDMIRLLVLGSL